MELLGIMELELKEKIFFQNGNNTDNNSRCVLRHIPHKSALYCDNHNTSCNADTFHLIKIRPMCFSAEVKRFYSKVLRFVFGIQAPHADMKHI